MCLDLENEPFPNEVPIYIIQGRKLPIFFDKPYYFAQIKYNKQSHNWSAYNIALYLQVNKIELAFKKKARSNYISRNTWPLSLRSTRSERVRLRNDNYDLIFPLGAFRFHGKTGKKLSSRYLLDGSRALQLSFSSSFPWLILLLYPTLFLLLFPFRPLGKFISNHIPYEGIERQSHIFHQEIKLILAFTENK